MTERRRYLPASTICTTNSRSIDQEAQGGGQTGSRRVDPELDLGCALCWKRSKCGKWQHILPEGGCPFGSASSAARTFSSSRVIKFPFLKRSRMRVVLPTSANVFDFGRTQCLLQFCSQMTRQKSPIISDHYSCYYHLVIGVELPIESAGICPYRWSCSRVGTAVIPVGREPRARASEAMAELCRK